MFNKRMMAAALLGSVVAMPASAAVLVAGDPSTAFANFTPASSTQGTKLASDSITGCSNPGTTFCGTMNVAVYRNTTGTLDFYYQFIRNTTGGADAVETITGGDFTGYDVTAYVWTADPDGAGAFVSENNPGANARAAMSLSGTVSVNFANSNPLTGSDASATYIFRTNAVNYAEGTFGVIDRAVFSGMAYQPAPPVPEPATWGLFIGGFGLVGGALRRARRRPLATSLV